MACARSFAAIFFSLPGTDWRAGDFAYNSRQDDIAFQFDTTFFERFAGHHESGDPAFHIGNAQALHLAIFDGTFEFRLRLECGDHAKVFRGSREARVRMAVESEAETCPVPLKNADRVGPINLHVLPDRFETVGCEPVQYELRDCFFLACRTRDAGKIAAELRQFVTVDLCQHFVGCGFVEFHWVLLGNILKPTEYRPMVRSTLVAGPAAPSCRLKNYPARFRLAG